MENQTKIKKGDIVTLKSGGPQMTVERYKWDALNGKYDENEVQCTWFKGQDKISAYFTVLALVKESEKKH